MKKILGFLCGLLAIFTTFRAGAVVYYVNTANATPVSPYGSWAAAATNIQDAISVASAGDTVLVTNGVYQFGGLVCGTITNRVCLNKALTVQSVNGPFVTVIQGSGITSNGKNCVRCAWLTNGATLSGFTLTLGFASYGNDSSGAGVACYSNAVVANCVIWSNTASQFGGGAFQGTLNNCDLYNNLAQAGSGAYNSALVNCTVINNTNSYGHNGLYGGSATNCIVYNNYGGNIVSTPSGAVSYCCTTPLPSSGTHNFTNAPQFFVDNVHLLPVSPCVGAGTNSVTTGTDLFGQNWGNPPSVGCCEQALAPVITQPIYSLSNNPIGFTLGALALNTNSLSFWWQENGTNLQDNGHFTGSQTTNLSAIGVLATDAGVYDLVASNSFGVVTSALVQVTIHFVNAGGTNPIAPYLSWATAATNLQDADSIAAPGDIVLATNGVYAFGGKSMDGVITNRLAIDRAIVVQSVNGPGVTFIQGLWNPTVTNGLAAIRCVWMTNSTALAGFTIQGGATRQVTAMSLSQDTAGGGIYGANTSIFGLPVLTNTFVFNCIIATNSASLEGGGAYEVNLNNCEIIGNQAVGSGVAGSGFSNAGSGGGTYGCNLNNCLVTGNSALQGSGGGTENGSLNVCALNGNSAPLYGGGAYGGSLANCTVSGNTSGGYGTYGGAVASATLVNCIVYGNSVRPSTTYTNSYNCVFSYCDSDPLPSGAGNIDVNPQFIADGIHLSATSPCLGAGTPVTNILGGTDIDGQQWSNPPAIGCDQWQPAPVVALQPVSQVQPAVRALSLLTSVAGQPPFTCYWFFDGTLVPGGSHYSGVGTTNLLVNSFDAPDAGTYRVVISNAFGVVTSQVVQVTIHCANAAGTSPATPFLNWATAATDIQSAVDAANPGDIILVANGLYATGGRPYNGGTSNRVVVSQPVTILSMNGWSNTVIQGAWDPATTNGPAAIRCCLLLTNASLSGFTLQGGATQANFNDGGGGVNGGGRVQFPNVFGILGTVNNCLLTGNQALNGGGAYAVNIVNCLVDSNNATFYGGGTYASCLTNCTVVGNTAGNSGGLYSLGNCSTANSIICDNFSFSSSPSYLDCGVQGGSVNNCCCNSAHLSGNSNLYAGPLFVDNQFHLAVNSPCRGTGSALVVQGFDLEGEAWAGPPSMGAYEVNNADLTSPLSVAIQTSSPIARTTAYPGEIIRFIGLTTGHAGTISWSWGDGAISTNVDFVGRHVWTNSGNYTVTFTAYNIANPGGVSATMLFAVSPVLPPTPQIISGTGTNGFQFQFPTQYEINYQIQTTTNLAPPVSWSTVQTVYGSGSNATYTVSNPTNAAQFFRLVAQSPL